MAVYADLVRYRELFANLFRRDFQAKYRGSALGILWSLVNPLALMGVYLLVFGVILNNEARRPALPALPARPGSRAGSSSRSRCRPASRSMVDSAELIKKVRFPRQLVAFSVVATQAVTFAVMLVILIVLSLVFVPDARSTVWLAIPLAVLFAAFVAGVALIVACLNVLFRDIEHILTAALLPWFFLTPILWSLDLSSRVRGSPSEAARGARLGQLRRAADRRRARRALERAASRGRRTWSTSRSRPSCRSCSARSCSAESTTGSRSSCSA